MNVLLIQSICQGCHEMNDPHLKEVLRPRMQRKEARDKHANLIYDDDLLFKSMLIVMPIVVSLGIIFFCWFLNNQDKFIIP